MTLQTEYQFNLPNGFVEQDGNVHRNGLMRLATAADEILPQKDPRVQSNPAYLTVAAPLARGHEARLAPGGGAAEFSKVCLCRTWLTFQEVYRRINGGEDLTLKTGLSGTAEQPVEVSISPGDLVGYPLESIYEEVAFLGYYLHWERDAIMNMPHAERRIWCEEVSKINRKIAEDGER